MSISLTALRGATENMVQYYKLVQQMRSTAMQLFTHPDASANDVMRTQQALMRTYAHYRETWKQIYEAALRYPRLERALTQIKL